ncbi:MAG TPA: glycine oxidase ThiO [Actinomycetota bacterium]|nr:glycine oxidase ThiO [Actinomycetota bacterium]
MQDCDVLVIGAGVIGRSIAWRVAQSGASVTLVDRSDADRSSWAAAGMLAPATEARYGENALLDLGLESLRRYPSFLEELSSASGIEVRCGSSGALFVALDRDQAEAAVQLLEFQRSLGLSVRWLEAQECRDYEPALAPSLVGGIRSQTDTEVDPRTLLAALELASASAGVRTIDDQIASITVSGGRASGVTTMGGVQVSARTIVLAAGCWSGSIENVPNEVKDAIRPVKGQVVRLDSRGPGTTKVCIVRTQDVYVVSRRDHLVVGATSEEKGFNTTPTAEGVYELLRRAIEVLPGIRHHDIIEIGVGLRPGSRDNAPLLGPTSLEGLIAATGHFRNGILLTPVTADAIATLVSSGNVPDTLKVFDPMRFA